MQKERKVDNNSQSIDSSRQCAGQSKKTNKIDGSTFKAKTENDNKCDHAETFKGKNNFCKQCGIYLVEVILLDIVNIQTI